VTLNATGKYGRHDILLVVFPQLGFGITNYFTYHHSVTKI